LIPYSGYTHAAEQIYFSPSISERDHSKLLAEIQAAQNRITHSFGKPTSRPFIIFTSSQREYDALAANPYGTAHVLGPLLYHVIIGPKGMNRDVIAHELMHIEMAHRLGFICYTFQFPAWLNEGIACLVDERIPKERKALEKLGREYMFELTHLDQFTNVPEQRLSEHYSAAKYLAVEITNQNGERKIYELLEHFRQNQSIDNFLANQPVASTEHSP